MQVSITIFRSLFLLFVSFSVCNCQKTYNEPEDLAIPLDSSFSLPLETGLVENDEIDEASGLAASRNHPGALWTHNDSGAKSRIFLIDESGKTLGQVSLKGIDMRDWEDISIGPGPKKGIQYLYIAEIGDNEGKFKTKMIYRFPEPQTRKLKPPFKIELGKKDFETIEIKYPDGKRDAETLMIDPLTSDIYIISKREDSVHVYRMDNPQKPSKKPITMQKTGQLHFFKAVAGNISPDGTEILVKNYANIYYWRRDPQESVAEALKRKPVRLPYLREPQGEAITWKTDGSAFYTLSEERHGIEAKIYIYKRK
ncbi:MAG: hypothetical protein NW226_10395 [Microscillaceae bacterium]|nr:hypothetical protein [Microscillaceae bacterium]